jgi:hypothetical protein
MGSGAKSYRKKEKTKKDKTFIFSTQRTRFNKVLILSIWNTRKVKKGNNDYISK